MTSTTKNRLKKLKKIENINKRHKIINNMTKEEKDILNQFEEDNYSKHAFWNGKLTTYFKDYMNYFKREKIMEKEYKKKYIKKK